MHGKTSLYQRATAAGTGLLLAIGICLPRGMAQAPAAPKNASVPKAAGKAEPKFKAIWEPINYKQDLN